MQDEEAPQSVQADTMEVHHHSHTPRKKIKHYFFEFFMLFLAVVCGSLAEYYLEYTVERHREHEFIESMLQDLKEDIVKIDQVERANNKLIEGQKQLSQLLVSLNFKDDDSVSKAYYLYRTSALNYENVVFTDRTLSQLKNSGGLRLIRNQAVSDSIMSYDAGIQYCEGQLDVVKSAWVEQSSFSYQLMDFGSYYIQEKAHQNDSVAFGNQVRLMSSDPAIIKGYASRLVMFTAVTNGYNKNLIEQRKRAKKLLSFLKEQYHLE